MPPVVEFRPWEQDYLRSFTYFAIALSLGWGIMLAGHPYWATAWLVFLGIRAIHWFDRGYKRERGIEVEHFAIGQAKVWLGLQRRYYIEANRVMPFRGNIDLIARPPESKVAFAVEIKSYPGIVRRTYGLTKLGKFYPLLRDLKQVKGQCKHLGADWHFPVVWCPMSTCNNFFEFGRVLVVNGDVNLLDQALQKRKLNVRIPATVSFPQRPPVQYRKFLKCKGFRFRDNKVWEGRVSQLDANQISSFVAEAQGQFFFKAA